MSRNACDGSSPILVCRVACHAELFAIPLLDFGTARLSPALVAELVAVVAGVKEGGASGIHTSDKRLGVETKSSRNANTVVFSTTLVAIILVGN